MSGQRRRFDPSKSLEERLVEEAKRLRAKAETLHPGPERDEMIRKAQEAEASFHVTEWLRSPGLRPPK